MTAPPDSQSFPDVVVSGIQPSGTLNWGNYFGALRQHIAPGKDETRRDEAYYFIVNYHALTSVRDAEALRRYSLDVALDYLALGFDPEKAHLFLQSDVPQVTELAWIFLCLTPVSRLEKGVAFKDKVAQGLAATGGLLAYPILQAADILIYGGTRVPVGADQKQNIEISRNLAQSFNHTFCADDAPIFPIPESLILEEVAVVPGTDGRKMSKSYGNTIGLAEEEDSIRQKLKTMITDPARKRRTDPGDPAKCPVFDLHKVFSTEETQNWAAEGCRTAGIGCIECKSALADKVVVQLEPIRKRRADYASRPDDVRDIYRDGARRAREVAGSTMADVRNAVKLVNEDAL